MKAFEFTIIASGLDPFADNFEDRFFEAGCDDATISLQKGLIILDFTREAVSFETAVKSAAADIERAGARVDRVEPDHLVSLSDIAKRAGISRAAVSLYAKGDRSRGFPHPVARVTTDYALWDWADVAHWLHRRGDVTVEVCAQAQFVRTYNYAIVGRNLQSSAGCTEAA